MDCLSGEQSARHHGEATRATERPLDDGEFATAERLAGRIAHDLNNLLFALSINLELLAEQLGGDPVSADAIQEASRVVSRGAGLAAGLAAFARHRPLRPSSVELNFLIGASIYRLRNTVGESVEVVTDLTDEALPVTVDVSQLADALVELAANARDAMPSGGRLVIATRLIQGQATIEVRDEGGGMTPSTLVRAFEPLFSTKPGGRGFGLTIVRRAVRHSGGRVAIASAPNGGTVVTITLPCDHAARLDRRDVETDPAVAGRGETILVVDSDPADRRLVAGQLEWLGYRVVAAEGARAALERLEAAGPIDLLFADTSITDGIDGSGLVFLARERRPALKVLLTSASSEKGALSVTTDGTAHVGKPYSTEVLARLVRAVLDAVGGAG